MITSFSYIDLETTGLHPPYDEILEIAIVDQDDNPIINTRMKPTSRTSWSDAQRIHGISPKDVKDAPTLDQIKDDLTKIISGQDIVIFNASFDSKFLPGIIESARSVRCAMEEFAEYYGEWNDYYGNYKWKSLAFACDHIGYILQGTHTALGDAKGCRAVSQFLDLSEEDKVLWRIEHIPSFEKQYIKDTIRQMESDEKDKRIKAHNDFWLQFKNRFNMHEREYYWDRRPEIDKIKEWMKRKSFLMNDNPVEFQDAKEVASTAPYLMPEYKCRELLREKNLSSATFWYFKSEYGLRASGFYPRGDDKYVLLYDTRKMNLRSPKKLIWASRAAALDHYKNYDLRNLSRISIKDRPNWYEFTRYHAGDVGSYWLYKRKKSK